MQLFQECRMICSVVVRRIDVQCSFKTKSFRNVLQVVSFFETLHINVTLMFVEFSFLWDKIQVYLDSSKGRKTWVRKLVHFLTSLIPSFSGRQCG